MPTRTPGEAITKLENLPAAKLLDLLDALAAGDLEAAKKAGGGITRAELAGFQPDGDSGKLLDDLEKRALFLLSRKIGIALMRALPQAIDCLRAISEGPSCEGEVEEGMDSHDVPLVDPQLPKHEQERLQRDAMRAIAQARVPNAKNLNEKRTAALALFDLANKLQLFDLARLYREPDRAADEEAELQRMAAAQGLDYFPPLGPLETPLRRVK